MRNKRKRFASYRRNDVARSSERERIKYVERCERRLKAKRLARQFSRGVVRIHVRNNKFDEREANKMQDDRFVKQYGVWRLSHTQTWTIQTRFGHIVLKTVTGGQDKLVRTRSGKRMFYAWVQLERNINIPGGMSQADFESQLGEDIWQRFGIEPKSRAKHLSHGTRKLQHGKAILNSKGETIGYGMTHQEYECLPRGKRTGCRA